MSKLMSRSLGKALLARMAIIKHSLKRYPSAQIAIDAMAKTIKIRQSIGMCVLQCSKDFNADQESSLFGARRRTLQP